jgi:hypothetical protein
MAEALAYLLTWTTYGTWLHGDERGSVDRHNASPQMDYHPDRRAWQNHSRVRMTVPPLTLSPPQRQVVEQAILQHCSFSHWQVIAVNCRTNHVHVLVVPAGTKPERVMNELKAYATRALREATPTLRRTWTRGGSTRYINSQPTLDSAIQYVRFQ